MQPKGFTYFRRKGGLSTMSEIRPRNSLTLSQVECARILATNDIHKMTLAEIAEHVGVNERTIYRWKADPRFIAYMNDIAEVAMEEVLTETYNVLKKLLREGKSEKTQLEAIKLILTNRGKLKDKQEITHEIKQGNSLQDLEQEVFDMENELLD